MDLRWLAEPEAAMASPEQRRVQVPVDRIGPWLDGFSARHGAVVPESQDSPAVRAGWRLRAADRSVAVVLRPGWLGERDPGDPRELPERAAGRSIAVLLLRRAGYLVALVHDRQVLASKVSSRHIHGRTAAGGWSQKRYSRRRDNQAAEIASAAAQAMADLAGIDRADVLCAGGDRSLLDAALQQLGQRTGLDRLPRYDYPGGVGTPERSLLASLPAAVCALTVELSEGDV